MTDPFVRALFLAQLASTLYMTGVIWFVQRVQYPLYANIGSREFPLYEQRHRASIFWIVGPPMLVEGASGFALLWFTPIGVPIWTLQMGVALLVVIWLSTIFLQVPCHVALSQAYDERLQRRLVATNWLRTVAWSLRGALVLSATWSALA
ncbi:MAG TPA: hypothetical protein VGE52_03650 [Pirellulales bacterium]